MVGRPGGVEMTMRRIEILVDAEFESDEHFEEARKQLEDEVWRWTKPRLPQQGRMVQANEVNIPFPSSGSREDYEHYRRAHR